MRLNLGCSDAIEGGYLNVDKVPPADYVADLEQDWPWETSSVDHIRAHDIFEHLRDQIHTMNEAWRVLKPGGTVEIVVPTTDGRGWAQDPTHKVIPPFNRNTFFYYTDGDPHRRRFGNAYGIAARFRVLREHEEMLADQVSKLTILLEAVKD